MRQATAALVMASLAIAAHAYPLVSSDPNTVDLNVWNTGLSQAQAKARALNRPTLMVMLDSVNCSYSKAWISKIADAPAWQSFLADNPLLLVMADKPKMSSSTWTAYTAPHRESTGILYFPTVVLFRPDGTVADRFIARNALGSDPDFYTRVRNTTDQYPFTGVPPPPSAEGTIGFTASAVTVSEGAPAISVSVTRQGGSSGAQTFAFTTEAGTALAGVHYATTSVSLSWPDGDTSTKTVSVPLINDLTWTTPTSRTLTLRLSLISGTAALGTIAQTVTITEVSPSGAPVFATPTPAQGATISASPNAALSAQIYATSPTPITYSATGLPAGFVINAATGLITGSSSLPGTASVTVTASNSTGDASRSFNLRILALPAMAKGTYQGFFYDSDGLTVRGTLSLTASSSGALSARAVLDGKSSVLSGKWLAGDTYSAALKNSIGGLLNVLVDAAGNLSGDFCGVQLFGRRLATARMAEFAGYYTSLLGATDVTPVSLDVDNRPEGTGYMTFTVSTQGTVRYSGALADGTLISGSSLLMVFEGAELLDLGYADADAGQTYACFPLYKALYTQRGVVAGQIWIGGMLSPLPDDNAVFITGSQWVYPGKRTTFPDDGFTATFDDGMFTEIGARFMQPQNLAASYDGASFQVEAGDVALQAYGLSVNLPSGNALSASLTASTTTGLFNGKFLHEPLTGTYPVTARFKGVLVPALGIGGGFYVDSYITPGGERLKQSKSVIIAP